MKNLSKTLFPTLNIYFQILMSYLWNKYIDYIITV